MHNKLKVLLSVALLIIFCAAQIFGLFPAVDNLIHDNVLISTRPVRDNIVIVGIDQRSINEIGRWPWPRRFVAETIEMLTNMGAAAIGVNVIYDMPGASYEYDQMLVDAALAAEGRVVFGGVGELSEHHAARGVMAFDEYALPFDALADVSTVGFLNMPTDADGVMRRALTSVGFGDITVHSFPYEVYRTYRRVMNQLPAEDIPLDGLGQFPINYAAGPGTFRSFSLWGVLHEEYPEHYFRDSIVLIGTYAHGIGDDGFPTPVDQRVSTFGVEICANIIQNFLENNFKQSAPLWLDLTVFAVIGLAVVILFNKLKPVPVLITAVVLVAVQLVAVRLVFDNFSIILAVGYVILFVVFCYISSLVMGILGAQKEKQQIQGLFGRFVAPEVVKQIIDSGAEIQLGGSVKNVTVVFVDIRGFTAFSEANPPEKVVAMVNRYLGLTSRSIQENGGTIDKYIGDATMAIFNAPNDLPDHAFCAVKAAWAMKQGSVSLRDEILKDYGVDLQFGVGVNTGPAVIGNMGSEFRMDYTAIGDTVNTAARLEANSQKGQIIISDATYQLVKDRIRATDLGLLNVKNKKLGIQIYNLDGIL